MKMHGNQLLSSTAWQAPSRLRASENLTEDFACEGCYCEVGARQPETVNDVAVRQVVPPAGVSNHCEQSEQHATAEAVALIS